MKFVLLLCCFYLITSFTLAQNIRSGRVAIGYSGNFSAVSNELGITYLTSDNTSVEPEFGFNYTAYKNSNRTVFHSGLGFLYKLERSIVSPYLGLRVKIISLFLESKTYKDWIGSLVFGGEYFVSDWFSLGAEMKLNYVKTDKEISPGYSTPDASILETEQVIIMRLYIN